MKTLSAEHLIGIKYLTKEDISLIFKTADNFKKIINIVSDAPNLMHNYHSEKSTRSVGNSRNI